IRPETLPYNAPFLSWLSGEHSSGRRLILATAADEIIARKIAGYLGIFEDVVASDGSSNLKGKHKLDAIQARDGNQFDYAGNSRSDLVLWRSCRSAIPVFTSPSVVRDLKSPDKVAI